MRGANMVRMLVLCCCCFFFFSSFSSAFQHARVPDSVVVSVTVNGNPTAGAGSTIHAVQGDTVIFTVALHNALPYDNVAVRWHGIGQIGTPTTLSDAFTYKLVVPRSHTMPATSAAASTAPSSWSSTCSELARGATASAWTTAHARLTATATTKLTMACRRLTCMRVVEAYLERVVPVDMIMAANRRDEQGAARSHEEDMKEKLKLWAKAVAQGAKKKLHAEASGAGRPPRTLFRFSVGKPSIEAVAMAGGTVDSSSSDDDMPPYHLRVESLLEDHEVLPLPPPAFLFLGPPSRLDQEPADPRVNVNDRRHTQNRMAMWFNGIMLWVTAAVASSVAAIRRPSRDP